MTSSTAQLSYSPHTKTSFASLALASVRRIAPSRPYHSLGSWVLSALSQDESQSDGPYTGTIARNTAAAQITNFLHRRRVRANHRSRPLIGSCAAGLGEYARTNGGTGVDIAGDRGRYDLARYSKLKTLLNGFGIRDSKSIRWDLEIWESVHLTANEPRLRLQARGPKSEVQGNAGRPNFVRARRGASHSGMLASTVVLVFLIDTGVASTP